MMKTELSIGLKGNMDIEVAMHHTAAHYGSGLIEVYATPAMIGHLENTAQQSVQKYLPDGYITVGISIEVKHLKATPVGKKVSCFTTLTAVEDRKLIFSLKAFDEDGEIGNGTHERFIVHKEKFFKKISS